MFWSDTFLRYPIWVSLFLGGLLVHIIGGVSQPAEASSSGAAGGANQPCMQLVIMPTINSPTQGTTTTPSYTRRIVVKFTGVACPPPSQLAKSLQSQIESTSLPPRNQPMDEEIFHFLVLLVTRLSHELSHQHSTCHPDKVHETSQKMRQLLSKNGIPIHPKARNPKTCP